VSFQRVIESTEFAVVADLRAQLQGMGVPQNDTRIRRSGVGKQFFSIYLRKCFTYVLRGDKVVYLSEDAE